MTEIHVLAFVQTEWVNGKKTFERRENKVAFEELNDALFAVEDQCNRMAQMYESAGYLVSHEDRENIFHYFNKNGLEGVWNFYIDTMNVCHL